MLLHGDIQANAKLPHENDSKGEEKYGDDYMNPKEIIRALEVWNGSVTEFDDGTLKFTWKTSLYDPSR